MRDTYLISSNEGSGVQRIFRRIKTAFGPEFWAVMKGPFFSEDGDPTSIGMLSEYRYDALFMDTFMDGGSIRAAKPGEAEKLYEEWCGGDLASVMRDSMERAREMSAVDMLNKIKDDAKS